MSGNVNLPGLEVVMTLPEWQVIFSALQEAPLPSRVTNPVVAKLQQQIAVGMTRLRANGSTHEAEDRP